MSYSGPITIFERLGYRLDSYGHGAAYTLTKLSDGRSCFFQGDDATTFREEFDMADEVGTDRAFINTFDAYDEVMTFDA